MYLIKVIPATKIPLNNPQILTYFTAHELKVGGLVLAPLHKRKVIGVVESIEKIHGQKMALRKAKFELRGIAKVISPEQVIDKKQFQLAKWISEYYWCSIGSVMKIMLPSALLSLQKTKKLSDPIAMPKNRHNEQQTLILAPNIHIIKEIAAKYNQKNAVILHSELTDKQNYTNWLKIQNGEAKIIISTRVALFAPFFNLKEIIIKDEHHQNYKSQQTPRYHAREVVIKLAELWGAKLTFKSATPSIESSWLSKSKRINLQQRAAVDSRLAVDIIDMRQELKGGNFSIFSRALQEKIKSAINKKQQIILFINRRGSSTALLCRDCGYVPKCPNCDVPLSYHLSPIQFLCHRCNHQEIPPVLCPNCLGTRIKFFGAGTQKTEAEFEKLFPGAKVARLDSDVAKNAQTIDQPIINFNNKKIQVLIGTQIIFNKGLNKAPLVAMMIADTILYLPDFRSNERTFQIISQLKTMANEEFILQTYSPENSAIQFAIKNDYSGRYARYIEHSARYKSFYQEEIQNRKELNYPPFSQLIKLVYQHASAKKTEEQAKILAEKIKQQITAINHRLRSNSVLPITILGPSPAFIPKVKGKYIWQIILKFTLPPIRASLASGGSRVEGSQIQNLKLRNQILKIIPPDWIVDIDPLQII